MLAPVNKLDKASEPRRTQVSPPLHTFPNRGISVQLPMTRISRSRSRRRLAARVELVWPVSRPASKQPVTANSPSPCGSLLSPEAHHSSSCFPPPPAAPEVLFAPSPDPRARCHWADVPTRPPLAHCPSLFLKPGLLVRRTCLHCYGVILTNLHERAYVVQYCSQNTKCKPAWQSPRLASRERGKRLRLEAQVGYMTSTPHGLATFGTSLLPSGLPFRPFFPLDPPQSDRSWANQDLIYDTLTSGRADGAGGL